MEVYATLTEHADYEVGRLVDGIEELGELDNTLIFYIFGDNGGSIDRRSERHVRRVVEASTTPPKTCPICLLASTSTADRTPTRTTRSAGRWPVPLRPPGRSRWRTAAATYAGMVVHWPKGIKAKGEIRRQYTQRHRRRADDPRSRRHPRAQDGQRRRADAHGRDQHAATRSTTATPRTATPRSTTSAAATAASTTTAGWPPWCTTCTVGARSRAPTTTTTTSGSSTTCARTSGWRTTWPTSIPKKLERDEDSSSTRRPIKYGVYPMDDRSLRAPERRSRRSTRHHGRAQRADALPRHDRHGREHLHRHHEPLATPSTPNSTSRGRRRRAWSSRRPGSSAAGASTSRTASRSTSTTGSHANST